MSIAEALRSARIAAGMTQRQIADALGVSAAFICEVELGRRGLGERHLAALPGAVAGPVAKAMLAEHHMAIQRIMDAT